MRTILAILFLLLYFGNTYICTWLFPYDANEPTTHHLYAKWWGARDVIYELMFVIILVSPLAKESKYYKAVFSSAAFLVLFSIVDKIQGITQYNFHDVYVVLFALLIFYYVYKFYKKKKK